MSKLIWDEDVKRTYETGVSKGVLYPVQDDGKYSLGVVWNGLTSVTESPSGAEATPMYADNIKYLNLISAEEFGATVEAYTYPQEFEACDGSAEIQPGVCVGQQDRKKFGMAYRTVFGNNDKGNSYGYKLHLIYGATAAPSEKAYNTINDSPEAITFSWELSTTPVSVENMKPTASVTIDSTKVNPEKLKVLEGILYGSESEDPRLPLPDEIAEIFKEEIRTLEATPSITNGASDVSITDPITITFNNSITKESVFMIDSNGEQIKIGKEFDADHKVLTITPKDPLTASSVYIINVIGVSDKYNQALPLRVIKFTTAAA